jgi:formate hydrogenlyase subunit 6/NADH:ubiquinone oxidoreductase subunit I
MRLTFRHLLQAGRRNRQTDIQQPGYFENRTGRSTVLYPYESVPVPAHGRYKLHNEIEDCIVCDKCAKICPVDCIDIEPIKSPVEFGKTSDGTSRRIYAATFDIDMAKCCFCGLCTTVCPTECLTMTPEYDFPVADLARLNFGFGNMTEEEANARRLEWERSREERPAARPPEGPASGGAAFRPRMKPVRSEPETAPEAGPVTGPEGASDEGQKSVPGGTAAGSADSAPSFKPRMRPRVAPPQNPEADA